VTFLAKVIHLPLYSKLLRGGGEVYVAVVVLVISFWSTNVKNLPKNIVAAKTISF
jgi:hypothetical protein